MRFIEKKSLSRINPEKTESCSESYWLFMRFAEKKKMNAQLYCMIFHHKEKRSDSGIIVNHHSNRMNKHLNSRTFFILIVFWILQSLSLVSTAQSKMEDVIYLRNGSVIRGTILEEKPGDYVRIESNCRNIWVFKSDEISRIAREEIPGPDTVEADKRHGFLAVADMGVLAGKGEDTKDAPFSIHTIYGYQFKTRLYCGAGLGMEFLNVTYVPLFADFRYHFSSNNITPYIFIQMGYNQPLENEDNDYYDVREKGGFLLNPGLGMRFIINPRTSIVMSVSYRYQELKSQVTYYWPEETVIRYEYLNRLGIRFGFNFH
ncbi:MAG: hypothetical protein JSV24_08425 [Bacteroidales bacterium]|nr:MAG: hypothetical protein JSV24_08425 [Bacteroidales bacterium]